jgi:tRNA threonylcarbamoyl adenosine modification protein YeaZ
VLVLAVDTSTPTVTAGVVGVALPHEILAAGAPPARTAGVKGAPTDAAPSTITVIAERTVTDAFGHAEHLMPLAFDALAAAAAGPGDLSAIVVGLGPGPFTGLRVGVATAQALGDALGIPVHGVPSHDGVALAVAGVAVRTAGVVNVAFLVVTDARRKEVYVSGYRGGAKLFGPLVAAPSSLTESLPEGLAPAWITGAGANLVADALDVPIRNVEQPISGGLVRAALRPLVTGAVPGPLTPLYLRRPDAVAPGSPKPVLPASSPTTSRR